MTITIILQIYQIIQGALPALLENFTLPGKHISIFIMRNDSHSVLLGREIFSRSLMEVTAEDLEILNQHYRMDGHVERFIYNMGATRHLKSL